MSGGFQPLLLVSLYDNPLDMFRTSRGPPLRRCLPLSIGGRWSSCGQAPGGLSRDLPDEASCRPEGGGLSAWPPSLPLGAPPCPCRDLPFGASSPRWPSSLTAPSFPAGPFLIASYPSPPGLPLLESFGKARSSFLPRGYILVWPLLPLRFLGPEPGFHLLPVRPPGDDLWGSAGDLGIWLSWVLPFGGCALCVPWGLLTREGDGPRGHRFGRPRVPTLSGRLSS